MSAGQGQALRGHQRAIGIDGDEVAGGYALARAPRRAVRQRSHAGGHLMDLDRDGSGKDRAPAADLLQGGRHVAGRVENIIPEVAGRCPAVCPARGAEARR